MEAAPNLLLKKVTLVARNWKEVLGSRLNEELRLGRPQTD